jgi:hypothetical protein
VLLAHILDLKRDIVVKPIRDKDFLAYWREAAPNLGRRVAIPVLPIHPITAVFTSKAWKLGEGRHALSPVMATAGDETQRPRSTQKRRR